jgi:septal ring factor EnvC (AmiA/AmiB activator)
MVDFTEIKDKASISIQTFAVIILSWLATELSELNREMKDLNKQMVQVVTTTSQHDQDIAKMLVTMQGFNRDYVSRSEFEKVRENLWDEITKVKK